MNEMVRDVVCARIFEIERAAGRSEYQGEMYYFCSIGCKTAFDAIFLNGSNGAASERNGARQASVEESEMVVMAP